MEVITDSVSTSSPTAEQRNLDLKGRFHEACKAVASTLTELESCLENESSPEEENNVRTDLETSLESVLSSLENLKSVLEELHDLARSEVIRTNQQRELEQQLIEAKVLLADALSRREELSLSLSSLKKRQSQDGKTSGSWQIFGSFRGMNTDNQVKDDFSRRVKLAEDRVVAALGATKRTRENLEELQAALQREEERTKELVKSLDELE
jgi:myosin heavy subunit